MPTFLKALLAAPLLIGGAIALTVLSYLAVPLMIIGLVLLFAYVAIKMAEDNETKSG